jgi:hypothetical protein
MKAEVIDKERGQENFEYPFLGKSTLDGKIVYFYEHGKGVVLHPGNDRIFCKGEHYDCFSMNLYEKLKGKVILEND